jgi:hypothetical protein
MNPNSLPSQGRDKGWGEKLLFRFLGCILGIPLSFAGKWLTRAANLHRVEQRVSPELSARLAAMFPNLDLSKVRIKDHANMPVRRQYVAIAFGYRVFFRHTYNENDLRFLRLLIHELVHAEQVHRLGGQVRFACVYFAGHFAAGYDGNPLEEEARAFVREHS